MIKKSIFTKFFLMNVMILILILFTQLIFQMVYFEPYYVTQKEKELKKEVSDFHMLWNENESAEKIVEHINTLSRDKKIVLTVKNNSLHDIINVPYYLFTKYAIIESDNGIRYQVLLESYPKGLDIKKGDRIHVVGGTNEFAYVTPFIFKVNGKKIEPIYVQEPLGLHGSIVPGKITAPASILNLDVTGKVVEVKEEDSSYFVQTNQLSNIIMRNTDVWNNFIQKDTETKELFFKDPNSDSIVYAKQFDNFIITAITQISEVQETIGVMNRYYTFTFFIFLVVVLIISYIYSRYISKPLVQMSKVADDISRGQFQSTYEVVSEDEIGRLGNSLNKISKNLEQSLRELQYANQKLMDKVNVQKEQEEKRKEFVANISHELKTPITIIQGYVNGFKSGMYKEEKYYDDMLEETERLNDLVMEMLEISKFESPEFTLQIEPFDLWGTFLKEYDKLQAIMKEKDLNVSFEVDEAIVYGDEKRIRQVITNLYTNAMKYSPSGEDIRISISLSEDEKKYVFLIENTGVTLNGEELANIWDSFYRGEKSRNKKYGGNGLGLAIVKIILELHESDFAIENVEDGVRFSFTLERCVEFEE